MLPKVLIVEDEMFVISYMLPTMQNNFQISWALNMEQARAWLAKEKFDVVLLDLDLGVQGKLAGLDLIPEIRETEAKIIVVSARCTGDAAVSCLANGIRAFVDKHECSDRLIPTIGKVLAGYQDFPDEWLASLRGNPSDPLPELDSTEIKVLDVLIAGPSESNATIAATIHRSESLVKNTLTDLYQKFDIKGRHNLVIEARRRGYLPSFTPAKHRDATA